MAGTETRTTEEMMTYEKDVKNKIAYLTLNRADKMNAPDTAMRIRYGELLRQANADDEVKVGIIRGAGDHFGTGADRPEQQEKMAADPLAEYDFDEDEDNIIRADAQHWRIKAATGIADFNEEFDSEFSDEECDTVGGLVLKAAGQLPKRGDHFAIGNFRFTVLHADSRRLYSLLVERIAVVQSPEAVTE